MTDEAQIGDTGPQQMDDNRTPPEWYTDNIWMGRKVYTAEDRAKMVCPLQKEENL